MPKKLTSTQRHKRELLIPSPERKGNIKVTREGWIECARVVLIEEGIGAVKVDRLAKRLNVTRGGFYYHFKNHHKLLEALLDAWRSQNRFTPEHIDTSSTKAAFTTLTQLCDNLIHEKGFDPQFDMAIREWARISEPVSKVVYEVDRLRTDVLHDIFMGLGCRDNEAVIRARVFYQHQIGYYTLGNEEETKTREDNLSTYLEVLCGEKYIAAARANGH